jgi:transposase
MPRSLPFPVREQIVQRHQRGEPLTWIAADLELPYSTVRQWWRRYRDEGAAGLHTRYQNCGPKGPKTAPAIQAAALAMKREHPSWGAGLIRVQLVAQFSAQLVPQIRAIQRWFQAAGLQPRRAQRPPQERHRAQAPHETWQMDAKEQMRLGDGSGTSVLTVTDEASGAVIGYTPFPPVYLVGGADPGGAAGAARPV